MDLLLDTNALVWVQTNSPRLGQDARKRIQNPRVQVYVSAVSAWEMAVKIALGRLIAPPHIAEWLPSDIEARGFIPLAVGLRHAITIERLPSIHRDPFDRLLIAQATVEDLAIVTADRRFDEYGVPVVPC